MKDSMNSNKQPRPVRVLQFGQGNFLRAFCDTFIDIANTSGVYDGSIVIAQSVGQKNPAYDAQNCCYTTLIRGKENGETVELTRVITSVQEVLHTSDDHDAFMAYASHPTLECVISNTTEAGIIFDDSDTFDMTPPASYPAKLTKFLYARYHAFAADEKYGLVIFPTELIENNGGVLRDCVLRYAALWSLGEDFTAWLDRACMFCSTLVDRIVTGHPKQPAESERLARQLGYTDALLTVAEPFGLWVIEAADPERARAVMPLDRAGLPVIFTTDLTPYRERKVRILNGAHTSFVPAAFLSGEEIVRDCMMHPIIRPFIDTCVYHEIIPTLESKLEKKDLLIFADAVCERFENPFIDHALLSICLNSVSKWKARVLPSVLDSVNMGKMPHCLVFSFASLCHFYASGRMTEDGFVGTRVVNGETVPYTISDSKAVLEFFVQHAHDADILPRFAANADFWGTDLTSIRGFSALAQKYYDAITDRGMLAAMEEAITTSRGL